MTRRGIFDPPSTLEEGFTALERWRQSPGLRFIGEGLDHFERLHATARTGRATGALFHDARVAAICLSHGVKVLWTADRDFSRFASLRVHNPIVS